MHIAWGRFVSESFSSISKYSRYIEQRYAELCGFSLSFPHLQPTVSEIEFRVHEAHILRRSISWHHTLVWIRPSIHQQMRSHWCISGILSRATESQMSSNPYRRRFSSVRESVCTEKIKRHCVKRWW